MPKFYDRRLHQDTAFTTEKENWPPPTNPDRILGHGDWGGVGGQVTHWA
ncbi:MAG: hypothetical protein QNJ16_18675 [Rhodobacter sp.]|nr:hypothetical protein [Rhodobacter sp.]